MRRAALCLRQVMTDPVLHAHIRHLVAVIATWLWRHRMPVFANALIVILVDLIYRGVVPAELGFLIIVGPLMTWLQGRDINRKHEAVSQEIAAIKGSGLGGMPPFYAGAESAQAQS